MKIESVTILLVEDEALFARALETKLVAAGYRVKRARDGSEALHIYDTQKVSLLVTDVIRSEKETLELIAEFRRIDPDVKIIAIASGALRNLHSYFSHARQLGAAETLIKPFSSDELHLAITSVHRN